MYYTVTTCNGTLDQECNDVDIVYLHFCKARVGSGNLKMVRPLTDNGFNGGSLARCDIKLYTE